MGWERITFAIVLALMCAGCVVQGARRRWRSVGAWIVVIVASALFGAAAIAVHRNI